MFLRYNLFGILWAIIIFVLSMLPKNNLPEVEIKNLDFLVHGIMYGVFAVLFIRGFSKQYSFETLRYYPVISSIMIGTFYGTLIEVCQHYFSFGRHFEVKDIVANFIGCLAGGGLFRIIRYQV